MRAFACVSLRGAQRRSGRKIASQTTTAITRPMIVTFTTSIRFAHAGLFIALSLFRPVVEIAIYRDRLLNCRTIEVARAASDGLPELPQLFTIASSPVLRVKKIR